MGYPMAQNLQRKLPPSDTLIVYDVRKEVVDRFVTEEKEGGRGSKVVGAKALEEIVDRADNIITMLPEPQHVRGVYSTLVSSHKPTASSTSPKLFIDSSTIDITTSLQISKQIPPSLGTFIDAPVSGGVVGATAGTLTFMLGAPPSVLPQATELLSLMGGRILPCGPPGSGLAAKLANNYLLAISNIAVCEAMNLGTRLGLDANVLKEVVNMSSGRCWASEVNNPLDKAKGDFKGGFGIGLMRKDLRLAMQAAEEVGAKLPFGEKTKEVYQRTEEEGRECKGRDFSVVYRWLGGKEKNWR
ncbi:hypothetical protein L211DRAFT_859023 [Terfezia boudieri ATCC MYA-4762]|uniref:3-hydroxyisobutyrate dehydrogenase n=1 Tax=Terfezia boudieri ATCC MYA-4762 TaxID=1051890 RepID=A0A3N4L9L7_9PEZI|nr:hypothetical protein L211DRAFT_859023 [Terfezia boudieri ATCC MYA-4762]